MTVRRSCSIFAVIPSKSFIVGKSRLGLGKERRLAVNRAFLTHVVTTVGEVLPPNRVIVVSRGEDALDHARSLGAQALPESGMCSLNAALGSASRWAAEQGAARILTLFSDLPYLEADDVADLCESIGEGVVTLAPDERDSGTNATLMEPAAIPYQHGTASFSRHLAAARRSGKLIRILRRTGLARDIDTPTDLIRFVKHLQAADTRRGTLPLRSTRNPI